MREKRYKKYVFDDRELMHHGLDKYDLEMFFNHLPEGANIIRWGDTVNSANCFFIVEHKSFELVSTGCNLPEVNFSFDEYWKKKEPKDSALKYIFIDEESNHEFRAPTIVKPSDSELKGIFELQSSNQSGPGTFLYELKHQEDTPGNKFWYIHCEKISDTPDVPKKYRRLTNYVYTNCNSFYLAGSMLYDVRVVSNDIAGLSSIVGKEELNKLQAEAAVNELNRQHEFLNNLFFNKENSAKKREGYFGKSDAIKTITDKNCTHEYKTYDSGFSKYEYCVKCDEKVVKS